jgi:hypothetical protein
MRENWLSNRVSLLACRPLRPRGVRSSTVPEQRCRHGLRRE